MSSSGAGELLKGILGSETVEDEGAPPLALAFEAPSPPRIPGSISRVQPLVVFLGLGMFRRSRVTWPRKSSAENLSLSQTWREAIGKDCSSIVSGREREEAGDGQKIGGR